MAITRLLLIKHMTMRAAASPSLLLSRTPLYDKFEPMKGLFKGIQSVRSSIRKINVQKYCRNSYYHFQTNGFISQSKFAWGSVFGASIIIGSICLRPNIAYSMNGFDLLEDDRHLDLSDDTDEVRRNFLLIARKVMLPFLLFLTVLTNLDHPAILAAKVILFLVGTKPSPLSIYVSVEQLRGQYMRELPIFLRFQSLYANKVEVDDYAIMCWAQVEIKDQKFTLVGILGNWWVFPSFKVVKDKVIHYIRN